MEANGDSSAFQAFKAAAENPLTRGVLKTLLRRCSKDRGSRLEVALELFVGARKEACLSCKLSRTLLSPLLGLGCRGFGVSQEQLKTAFRDGYWRRGLISILKGIAWFGVRRPYVPGAPLQVVWNITHACNLKCLHCYENASVESSDELTTDEALRGIDILADSGVLILAFSGGEPTLRPDIIQLIEHSSSRDMYTAIATNAILLSSRERVKRFKRAGLKFVQISLDGVFPKTHDCFRGVHGAFEKTVQGIKNCVAEDMFTEVATTVTRLNQEEILGMIDFSHELGADWLMLYNFVPTGRGVHMIRSDLAPEERENVLRLCWNKMKATGIQVLSTAPQYARVAQQIEAKPIMINTAGKVVSGYTNGEDACVVPTHFSNPRLSGELKRLADFIGGCGCGRFYVALEPNGDIYPCVFFPHDETMKVGNIFRDDFEQIWRRSRLFWKLRDKDKLKANCGICQYRYTWGGCRARAYNYFGDVLAPDPGCIRNEEAWRRLNQD
jgi:radical SAM protein with 4Fe4S-binding SPASM domain